MSAPKHCECGNRILIFLHPRRNPKARVRGLASGRTLKGHDVCAECWRGLLKKANGWG